MTPDSPVKRDRRVRVGSELVRKEADVWEARGWTIEKAWRQYLHTKRGTFATQRDFFRRYDFMAAAPAAGALALVQVSADSEGGHAPPLGFANEHADGPVEFTIDAPAPGVYEVYVYYRKLKGDVRWHADRRWWRLKEGQP